MPIKDPIKAREYKRLWMAKKRKKVVEPRDNFVEPVEPEIIYKSGCESCLKSIEDPTEKYICPKNQQHLAEWEKWKSKKVRKCIE